MAFELASPEAKALDNSCARLLNAFTAPSLLEFKPIPKEKVPTDFGIEVEGRMKGKRFTRTKAAQIIARNLKVQFDRDPGEAYGFKVEVGMNERNWRQVNLQDFLNPNSVNGFQTDGVYRISYVVSESPEREIIWEVSDDLSLNKGMRSSWATEVKSPKIGRTYDEKGYNEIMLDLERSGFEPTPESGTHVHVNFPNPRPLEVALLMTVYSKIEKELHGNLLTPERRHYVHPLSHLLPEIINPAFLGKARMKSLLEKVRKLSFEKHELHDANQRYYGLNVLALESHGSVEFRAFPGTNSPANLESYRRFAQAFVVSVRSQDTRLLGLLVKYPDKRRIPLKELCEVFNVGIP